MDTRTMAAVQTVQAVPAQGVQQPAQQAEASFSQVLNAAAQAQNGAQDARQAVPLPGMVRPAQDVGEPAVADPVLAQLLQLLKDMQGDSGGAADMVKLAGRLQRRLEEILERGGGEMAGQQALALMSALVPEAQVQGTADTPRQSASAVLNMLVSVQPETLARLIAPEANAAQAGEAPQAAPLAQAPLKAQPAAAKGEVVVIAGLPEAAGTEAETAAVRPTGGVQSFEAAVRMAKQQMQAAPKAGAGGGDVKPAPEADVDALQKQVDAGTFMQGTALAAAGPETAEQRAQLPVPAPEVQLREGVAAGMAKGENEFTVKLAPEGLGEVTIRLHEAGAKMTLEIIAKNPETQKLLAGQMDQLREALRPLKVEVESVVSEGQYEMLSGSRQQFGGQARQSWQEMRGAAYYGDEPLAGEAARDARAAESLAAALNTLA